MSDCPICNAPMAWKYLEKPRCIQCNPPPVIPGVEYAERHNYFTHKRLEAQVEVLTKELGDLLKAKTISCTIPSATMEHEFQRHYRHGWENGVQVERERRIKLVALLREAALHPELGGTLLDAIKHEIVEAEKLK